MRVTMSRPIVGVRDNSLIVANVCLFNCLMMRNHSASHLHNRCRVLGVERAKRARTRELAARSVVPNEAFPNPRTRNSTCFPARLTILMSAVLVLQIQCWTHGFFVFLVVGDAFACFLIPIRLIALFCLSFSSCSLAACKHCANRHLSRFGSWEGLVCSYLYLSCASSSTPIPNVACIHRHMSSPQYRSYGLSNRASVFGYPWIFSHPVIGHTCTAHQLLWELHHRCNLRSAIGHEFISILICI